MDMSAGNGLPNLRELLAFYAEAGVDEALTDDPADRLAVLESAARLPSPPGTQRTATEARPGQTSGQRSPSGLPSDSGREALAFATSRGPVAVPDEAQVALARERAAKAESLDDLRLHLAQFEGCNLRFTAKNLVFADGNPAADIMLVGEAPGRDEDLEGLPFVGRSGQLLDRILAAIGLDRQSVYIANAIPWRPPGNRAPTPQETEICRPFIERQIELANPKVLVTLGNVSAKTLLQTTEGVMRLRGNWKAHVTASGISIPAMPTLHPAYLLRNPAHKKFVWRDFLEVQAKLRTLRG